MKVIIMGAGGHGKVVADIIDQHIENNTGIFSQEECIVTFLDDHLPAGTIVANHPVIGEIKDCADYPDASFVIAVGSNEFRKEISERYELNYISCIHPTAVIGSGVRIEKGSVVMANAVINAEARVGQHCIINSGAIVEHDNVIGNYAHVSPGVTLGGNVQVGDNTWVGIGATVKNGVDITSNCIIGAGAVVVNDIKEPGTYVGVPVRRV